MTQNTYLAKLVGIRPGVIIYVIVIVTITIVQVIIIDGTDRNVIESKVIVIGLLLCYYN